MDRRTAREQFDQQASHYDAQWNTWSEENLHWLVAHSNAKAADSILDVATGTGFTAFAFARLVASVTGVDVSDGMLKEAREQASAAGLTNIEFRNGAAESIPFPSCQFDLVTCRMAAHHFVSVPQFLADAHRVLKQGGRLLIADTTVPDQSPELDLWQNRIEALRDPSHRRNYSPGEWREFILAAHFRLEEIDYVSGSVPITLNVWLKKGGCTGGTAEAVRTMFNTASPAVQQAFRIEMLPDGDTAFQWMRVAIAASRV